MKSSFCLKLICESKTSFAIALLVTLLQSSSVAFAESIVFLTETPAASSNEKDKKICWKVKGEMSLVDSFCYDPVNLRSPIEMKDRNENITVRVDFSGKEFPIQIYSADESKLYAQMKAFEIDASSKKQTKTNSKTYFEVFNESKQKIGSVSMKIDPSTHEGYFAYSNLKNQVIAKLILIISDETGYFEWKLILNQSSQETAALILMSFLGIRHSIDLENAELVLSKKPLVVLNPSTAVPYSATALHVLGGAVLGAGAVYVGGRLTGFGLAQQPHEMNPKYLAENLSNVFEVTPESISLPDQMFPSPKDNRQWVRGDIVIHGLGKEFRDYSVVPFYILDAYLNVYTRKLRLFIQLDKPAFGKYVFQIKFDKPMVYFNYEFVNELNRPGTRGGPIRFAIELLLDQNILTQDNTFNLVTKWNAVFFYNNRISKE